ncbi:hypothetical protein [Thalassobaculum sp.]|uniref:hypothetical protein n=1 Tax=Thalassobaculum sp. TaxID=2022740 RepID=UPI0032EC6971
MVIGNYVLAVKARDRISPIDARSLHQFMIFIWAAIGISAACLINLNREEPPELDWWIISGVWAAVPMVLAYTWWRLGRWPIRIFVSPFLFGLPWDPNDTTEPENRRRPPPP